MVVTVKDIYLGHGLLTEGKTLVYNWCHACNLMHTKVLNMFTKCRLVTMCIRSTIAKVYSTVNSLIQTW